MIDLRSDTVTRPGQDMLEAMMQAKVGDDVFNEDPTVNELEEKAAKLFGKEASLYCPSGTMTNQIAIKVNTQDLDEIICDKTAHIYNYETGGFAFNSRVSIKLLDGDRGRFTAQDVLNNIQPEYDWLPRTKLVAIENTCNKAGGSYYSLEAIQEISAVCKAHNLKFHLDGARLLNALTETGDSPSTIGKYFDTISICLSKGLGAPVGSLLIGSQDDIKQARRFRKVMGGGMRQAGFLAAAGIFALDNNIVRLAEDHQRAKVLGNILAEQDYVHQVFPVDTNIVIFQLTPGTDDNDFLLSLQNAGVLAVPMAKGLIRLVTHLDFDDQQLDQVSTALTGLKL